MDREFTRFQSCCVAPRQQRQIAVVFDAVDWDVIKKRPYCGIWRVRDSRVRIYHEWLKTRTGPEAIGGVELPSAA
jgi:hypothetical protein